MPGTWRIWLSNLSANLRLPSDIGAVDLNIDRRGQAEIQDLGDHVGGQEIEHRAGKLAVSFRPQRLNPLLRRVVILFERNQDVGVRRADHAAVVVSRVDAAVGQAHVVDDAVQFARRNLPADRLIDQIADARGLLDAGSGLGAEVQAELAVVAGREEILPKPRESRKRAHTDSEKHRDENQPAVNEGGEQQLIAQAQPLETAFETPAGRAEWIARFAVMPVLRLRFSRYIASVGTSVRERIYDASIANTTASASGTNRYFATPLRKNIGRNTMQIHSVETSAGTAICAAPSRIALCRSWPSSRLRSMFSIVDRCVVDQDADRQRQTAQRHDVDGLVDGAQHADRNQNRKRNRDRDDQRAAPASEKDQNHDAGQAGGDDRFAHHSLIAARTKID